MRIRPEYSRADACPDSDNYREENKTQSTNNPVYQKPLHTAQRLTALLLAVLLLFPVAVEAVHAFEHDFVQTHTETGTDIQQADPVCNLCDLQVVHILSLPTYTNIDWFVFHATGLQPSFHKGQVSDCSLRCQLLRGPPSIV